MGNLHINRYLSLFLLTLMMLICVMFSVSCPSHALAAEVPGRSQVEEFLQSDEAKQQIGMLIQAAQSGETDVNASQITSGVPGKVLYLHYDDAGALANSITDNQSFDWVAPVKVNGQPAGQVIVWNNEGRLEVGNYDSDKGMAQMLNGNDDVILICDEFSHAYYSLANDVVTPLNEAAKQVMPNPLPAAQADEAIRTTTTAPATSQDLAGSGPGSVTTIAEENGKSVNVYLLIGIVAVIALVSITIILATVKRSRKAHE